MAILSGLFRLSNAVLDYLDTMARSRRHRGRLRRWRAAVNLVLTIISLVVAVSPWL